MGDDAIIKTRSLYGSDDDPVATREVQCRAGREKRDGEAQDRAAKGNNIPGACSEVRLERGDAVWLFALLRRGELATTAAAMTSIRSCPCRLFLLVTIY